MLNTAADVNIISEASNKHRYLAISDMDMGNIPMVFPPIRYSEVVFCFLVAKNAKYTPMRAEQRSIPPKTR